MGDLILLVNRRRTFNLEPKEEVKIWGNNETQEIYFADDIAGKLDGDIYKTHTALDLYELVDEKVMPQDYFLSKMDECVLRCNGVSDWRSGRFLDYIHNDFSNTVSTSFNDKGCLKVIGTSDPNLEGVSMLDDETIRGFCEMF